MNDAMQALEKKEELETAKRAIRDSMYISRYAAADKAKLMGESLHDAAAMTGVAAAVAPPPPSPYRLT